MLEETIGKIVAAVVSALTAGFLWLVRTVFTNQQQVKLLQQGMLNLQKSNEHQGELLREKLTALEKVHDQKLSAAMEKANMNHDMLKSVLEGHYVRTR